MDEPNIIDEAENRLNFACATQSTINMGDVALVLKAFTVSKRMVREMVPQLTAANARIAEFEAQFSAALSRETDARNRCAEYADEFDVAKARIDAVPVDALRRLVQSIRNSSVFVQTQDLRDANVWLESQQVQP